MEELCSIVNGQKNNYLLMCKRRTNDLARQVTAQQAVHQNSAMSQALASLHCDVVKFGRKKIVSP